MTIARLSAAIALGVIAAVIDSAAQATRPPAPTRDPNTPGYVAAKELVGSWSRRVRIGRAECACVARPYTRRISVYVPSQYVPGSVVPFIVGADGPDPLCSRRSTV